MDLGAAATVMLSALVTGLVVATLAGVDAHAILEGAPQVTKYCRLKLAGGALCFVLLGVLGWAAAAATQYGAQLKIFNSAPPSWTPILGGVVLVQALRLDYFRPTDVAGVHRAAADRESMYRKLLRIWLNDIYRGLIGRVPDEIEARMLIRRGLVSAYSYSEISAEFRTWSDGRANAAELARWLEEVRASKYGSPERRSEMLIRHLLSNDLEAGRALAIRRAPAIVVQKAF